MVHRPIFLGIAMGVSPVNETLDLSITINDGYFVLGTKNYSFPIISGDSDSTPPISPQASIEEDSTADDEFEEIKGMYIELKRKVVIKEGTDRMGGNKLNDCIRKGDRTRDKIINDKRVNDRNTDNGISDSTSNTDNITSDNNISDNSNADSSLTDSSEVCPFIPFPSLLPLSIAAELKKEVPIRNSSTISFNYFDNSTLTSFSQTLITVLDKWIGEYSKGNAIKIVGAGISTASLLIDDFDDEIKALLWGKYDILPCFFNDNRTLDQQSESLARKCANMFGQDNLLRLSIVENNRVNVDGGNIWYCSLKDYAELKPVFSELISKLIVDSKLLIDEKVSYFSSTPQGGGVALMRHSLIRFFTMLGVDASWYVCMPSPSVFKITKKKIHNVLQGVSPPDTVLSESDMLKIDKWLKNNYETNWKRIVKNSTIIVLDDQQVARLLPLIRKDNPKICVIYRSHIQIRESDSMQKVWSFLWDGLKSANYFVAHPIPSSLPKEVPNSKIFYNPAGTDPLDGLNKTMSVLIKGYYHDVFNRICIDNGENPLNFSNPYIVQICRFDPSKGIPDLLEAYYLLYKKYSEVNREMFNVGLVICGHGSVDDPEGTTIFKSISSIVESERFLSIKHLITKVRLPPSDQLLNVVLSGAKVCCQLSVCEGYEVKVTESLMKGVPVVVYDVGGLPLQVKNGINGYIVESRNVKRVSECLYDMLIDDELYKRLKNGIGDDWIKCTTPYQGKFWIDMFKRVINDRSK